MTRRERARVPAQDIRSLDATTSSQDLLRFPAPRSRNFRRVLERVEKFARDVTITIVFEGETGTGKNWLARGVHQRSPRADRAFHEISLAGMNDSLAGSDLFGHIRGAFTDAREHRAGAFLQAHQGTLFIDEIGKASHVVQKLLLRAIEERVIQPVGADRLVQLDVRLVAATNVSLLSLVDGNHFLCDLYARLGLFTIRVPPLRERAEDIPDLARYFVAKHAVGLGYTPGLPTIHPELMASLQHAEWKYNLRELDTTMHRLIIEADSAAELTLEHCADELGFLRARSRGRPIKSSPDKVAAIVRRSKSKAAAARELDISRSTLYRRLGRADAEPPIESVAK